MTKTCLGCGGFVEETDTICPICGYDFSKAAKEEALKKRVELSKKISKYVLFVSLIVVVIITALTIVLGVFFSKEVSLQKRINYFFNQTEQHILYNKRVGYFFNNADQHVMHNIFLQTRVGHIRFDTQKVSGRFTYAVKTAEKTINNSNAK